MQGVIPTTEGDIHVVYNIGCGGNSVQWHSMLIQAVTLDYSWSVVHQRGKLTRIVSGCENDSFLKSKLSSTTLPPELMDRFDVYFTEANDTVGKIKYPMFNRPNALIKYFAEKGVDGVIYIVLGTFSNYVTSIFMGYLDPDFAFVTAIPETTIDKVGPHKPAGGVFYMGTGWRKWDSVCASLGSFESQCLQNLKSISSKESRASYEIGAPYLMYKSDWEVLLPLWIRAIPPAMKYYNGKETDMYAYSIVSATLGMPHFGDVNLMRTCMRDLKLENSFQGIGTFVHYCQRYMIYEPRGEKFQHNPVDEFSHEIREHSYFNFAYIFSKYWYLVTPLQNQALVDCGAPLLVEPPRFTKPEWDSFEGSIQFQYKVMRFLVPLINDALSSYKTIHCGGKEFNAERKLILHEYHNSNPLKKSYSSVIG